MLEAGIDVYSTVNVQHLETLNDRVYELTGVRVRETFPDSVLDAADELVLADLTPEALTQRLREGKVYPRERIATALDSFFKVENLSALRELALREVAEDVEAKRLVTPVEALGTREEQLFGEPPAPVAERILVLVRPDDRSDRLIRRAWRSSQRLAAELDLLYVAPPGEPPRGELRERVEGMQAAGVDPGRDVNRGGGRRPRGRGGPGRVRPRHDLRADGTAAGTRGGRAAEGVDRRAPDAQAARRGRADSLADPR